MTVLIPATGQNKRANNIKGKGNKKKNRYGRNVSSCGTDGNTTGGFTSAGQAYIHTHTYTLNTSFRSFQHIYIKEKVKSGSRFGEWASLFHVFVATKLAYVKLQT